MGDLVRFERRAPRVEVGQPSRERAYADLGKTVIKEGFANSVRRVVPLERFLAALGARAEKSPVTYKEDATVYEFKRKKRR